MWILWKECHGCQGKPSSSLFSRVHIPGCRCHVWSNIRTCMTRIIKITSLSANYLQRLLCKANSPCIVRNTTSFLRPLFFYFVAINIVLSCVYIRKQIFFFETTKRKKNTFSLQWAIVLATVNCASLLQGSCFTFLKTAMVKECLPTDFTDWILRISWTTMLVVGFSFNSIVIYCVVKQTTKDLKRYSILLFYQALNENIIGFGFWMICIR